MPFERRYNSSKHNADRAVAAILGERNKKAIDRPAILARRCRRYQLENAILDGQRRIGRDDVDAVRLASTASLAATTGMGLFAPSSSTKRLL
jgi:hypothetical protein